RFDVGGLTDHFQVVRELGANAGSEQIVIVDDEDTDGHSGTSSFHSVPQPGSERTVACPPRLATRPMMDSLTPSRSVGRSCGSKPRPRSRTNTRNPSPLASPKTDTTPAPEWAAALAMASPAAAISATELS